MYLGDSLYSTYCESQGQSQTVVVGDWPDTCSTKLVLQIERVPKYYYKNLLLKQIPW